MSKIRLHGSSSGYTEIAPVAASGNNTLTLPNDGTIISKDSNGAVGVTSVHATNVVATGTAKVGSGVTLSSDGDVFFTGVSTGNGSGLTAVNTPSFSAYVTGNPSISGNTNTIVVFNVEDHDTDDAYNNSTGVFTVPAGKAGKYHISAYGGIDDIDLLSEQDSDFIGLDVANGYTIRYVDAVKKLNNTKPIEKEIYNKFSLSKRSKKIIEFARLEGLEPPTL